MAKKMTVRRFVLLGHQWLGLAASLVLSIAGVTGAVLVWPDDFRGRWPIRRFHDSLALDAVGHWIVLIAAGAAVLLQVSGLVLWWRRRSLAIHLRFGWRRAVLDVHQAVGVVCLAVMLIIAATAIARPVIRAVASPETVSVLQPAISRFHTTVGLPAPVKIIYAIGSLAFLVQAVSGVLVWWKPRI